VGRGKGPLARPARVVSVTASTGIRHSTVTNVFAQGQGQGGGRDQAPGQNRATTSTTFPISSPATLNGAPVGDFTGRYTIENFVLKGGTLTAVGHVTGTLANVPTGALPGATGSLPVDLTDVEAPVRSINGKSLPSAAVEDAVADAADLQIAQVAACDILNLVLGPLHLNLLGLVVDLNQVILNITGQPGPGNLLGNLLCAITGLLDRPGSLQIIANLLQSILDILNLP
jgi:hypothetical protein